jgi:hypothetical protein
MSKIFISLFLILVSFSSWSADLPKIEKLFKNTFWTIYQERYCGRNIESFSTQALEEKINMRGAYIMEIRNAGFDTFGMVASLNAREAGRLYTPERSEPPFRQPGGANWHFHVVLLADGVVHDYDFGNIAEPIPMKQYFEKMYIPTDRMSDIQYKKKKIGAYEISLYPVEDYMTAKKERRSVTEIATTYEVRLEKHSPELFK